MNEKDLCFFSLLSLIIVFYFIEVDSWLKHMGFIPGGGLPLGLAVEAFTGFRLAVFSILYFNISLFSNRTSDGNITISHLRKSW